VIRMRAMIVYESLWGNTELVARAIGRVIATQMPVDIVDTDHAPDSVFGYDLIIVGGPTHAFSMSRPATRESAAANDAAPHVPRRGIREWLSTLAPAPAGTIAAAFDTRVDSPRLPGSAAKAARHELRSLGFSVDDKAKSFRVHGYQGPLADGELDRAVNWASELTFRERKPVGPGGTGAV